MTPVDRRGTEYAALTPEGVATTVRVAQIAIKARPRPGEGRWAAGLLPSASPDRVPDVVVLPATTGADRESVRVGLVAMLLRAEAPDAASAAASYLLHVAERHPQVLRRVLNLEVRHGSASRRLGDVIHGLTHQG